MDGSNDTGNNSRTTLNFSDNISTNSIPHGELLCWGCGEFGQHCHGHSGDVGFSDAMVDPCSLEGSSGGVSAVACGSSHTVLVTGSGQIYVWGNGNSGQLGCGDQTSRWKPTQIHLSLRLPPGATIRSVACGSRHTMVVLTNGHVYSFGNNFYAQLGYNFREKNYKENQVERQCLYRVASICFQKGVPGRSVFCKRVALEKTNSQTSAVGVLVSRPVRQVSCGDKHSLFLFDDGDVAAVGNNAHGQIGDGGHQESVVPKPVELDHPVREITCGPNHNLVITEEGQLYIWGYSKACGRRRHDVRLPEHIDIKGKEIRQAAGGSSHSLALTVKGKVYSWGFGPDGQLGLGPDLLTSAKPHRLRHSMLAEGVSRVACGDAFSAAVTVTGRPVHVGSQQSHHRDRPGLLTPCVRTQVSDLGSREKPDPPRVGDNPQCGVWRLACSSSDRSPRTFTSLE
ncbi:ultraviolet-B receptor UVR8-like [Pomacea canaliculata]|uniref:ultraviolet-B receptor UVR8-like n=1 Tax=Pomacea canaliculata TaxID=400727 RepID=UPI000D733B0D|nr:ultraviolet-B receptor UVR8-like [Pomacea canaliculata]